MRPVVLSPDQARAFLVGHHGLTSFYLSSGAAGVRELLRRSRCIQLDPLDVIGTNADLVALARVKNLALGDVYRHLLPGHAFEHFAKERCLIPASVFPRYRQKMTETPWWRLSERLKRLDPKVIEAVYEEVRDRGPLTADQLLDRGRVRPLDWNGWKGTARASSMALEVLWTQCRIVVSGRASRSKIYDIPERSLGVLTPPGGDFARWALGERVEAAGLLCRASGPVWSMISDVRASALPDELVREGVLEEVVIEGAPRRYLAPAGFRSRKVSRPDRHLRILAPLDPLLWDRALVRAAFGFEYIWEVYKPAEKRRWGWYVCPLLQDGHLVGRIQARLERQGKTPRLVVERIWREPRKDLCPERLHAALERHAAAAGVSDITYPRGWRRPFPTSRNAKPARY